jgi:hypothetical protein
MHQYVKQGLERMREPGRVQGRHTLKDGEGNLCALGCIVQSAVDDGCAKWIPDPIDPNFSFISSPDTNDVMSDVPRCVMEAYQDLRDHGIFIMDITSMNDTRHKPLPEIASWIEAKYALTEDVTS